MYKNIKPAVVLSNCLEYKACRYNGEVIHYNFVKMLVSSIVVLLKSWIIKFDQQYLMDQTFFNPYPEELMCLTDSGKGREF